MKINWKIFRFQLFNIFLFYLVAITLGFVFYHHWVKPLHQEIASLKQENVKLKTVNAKLVTVVGNWQVEEKLAIRAELVEMNK